VEATGGAKGDRTTKAIVSTFIELNKLADFEPGEPAVEEKPAIEREPIHENKNHQRKIELQGDVNERPLAAVQDNVDFKVGYTINLNLPETTDPEVFNAIFKSLKENLLKS
jgi:hypothetical protein